MTLRSNLAEETLDALVDDVEAVAPDRVEQMLALFPIESIPVEYVDVFFIDLLNRLGKTQIGIQWNFQAQSIIISLIEKWRIIYDDSDNVALFILSLFERPTLDDKPIIAACRQYLLNGFEIFRLLIEWEDGPTLPLLLDRAWDLFGADLDVNLLQQLLEQINTDLLAQPIPGLNNHATLRNFLNNRLAEMSETAPTPPWMRTLDGKIPSMAAIAVRHPTVPPIPQLNLEQQVELLATTAEYSGLQLTESGASLREQIRRSLLEQDSVERELATRDLLRQLQTAQINQDDRIFQVYGPCNALTGVSLLSQHPCARYGGCRMFLCTCLDEVDSEDDEIDEIGKEWFTGSCQMCQLKIEARQYAIRIPEPEGGWRGIYCSIPCLRRSTEADLDNASYQKLFDQLERDLNARGILHRIGEFDLEGDPVTEKLPGSIFGEGVVIDEFSEDIESDYE